MHSNKCRRCQPELDTRTNPILEGNMKDAIRIIPQEWTRLKTSSVAYKR